MDTPQQPELHRSGYSAADPGAVKATASSEPPGSSPSTGTVPEDNRPGHHPDREQDQPDLDAVAARLGTVEPDEANEPVSDAPSDLPPAPDQPAEGGVATVEEALRNQGLAGADD